MPVIFTPEKRAEWAAWLATRPACVQALAKEFPIDRTVAYLGRMYYVVGYTEDDKLLITKHDPSDDWDLAMSKFIRVCAVHLRKPRAGTGPESPSPSGPSIPRQDNPCPQ